MFRKDVIPLRKPHVADHPRDRASAGEKGERRDTRKERQQGELVDDGELFERDHALDDAEQRQHECAEAQRYRCNEPGCLVSGAWITGWGFWAAHRLWAIIQSLS